MKIDKALISVSDKTGLVPFAKRLIALEIEIISTGGTAKLLGEKGVPVTEVADYTGFPEMMAGRLKTLHPKVHGGLLGKVEHAEVMEKVDIPFIGLLVVNLYPFAATIARPGCTLAEAIEQIDIGGPAMVRSAAKNFERVASVTDPADYDAIALELESHPDGPELSCDTRFRLAVKAFRHTAEYDAKIWPYLEAQAK